MTLVLLVAVLGLMVLISGGVLLKSTFGRLSTVVDLAGKTRATDLDAFLNLVDQEEEDYLRTTLNPSDFALVHRSRVAAAMAYVVTVLHNAGIVLALGEAAQRHEDRQVIELGKDIAENAVRLRVASLAALYKLGISYLRPSISPSMLNVVHRYRAIEGGIRSLCHIQAPDDVNRILAAL